MWVGVCGCVWVVWVVSVCAVCVWGWVISSQPDFFPGGILVGAPAGTSKLGIDATLRTPPADAGAARDHPIRSTDGAQTHLTHLAHLAHLPGRYPGSLWGCCHACFSKRTP